MTKGEFLSTAYIAAILGGVATLAVLSALTLAPFDRLGRRSIVAFFVCLVAIWVGVGIIMVLIGYTI
jgi:ABC-type sugar transport system permease subunit